MCGINGIVVQGTAREGLPQPRREIAAMNAAVAHRGPDGEGEYLEPGLALGHRRLAIIDLSSAGRQPMFNEDGELALVFNGEIYNYRELMPELQAAGHVFRSKSDSEVILHAYEEWGEDCVRRFNGMWAFAIWDRCRKTLFLSRDRLGVKPLCWLQRGGRFVFSSEPAGILAVEPVHEAHAGKLHDYLAYGYHTNDGDTFFAGIRDLPPGCNATLDADGRMALRRHWSLDGAQVTLPPAAGRAERYRELLADAVRLRFRSDVPVALLQSGGLDSSAICATVNDEIESGRLGVNEVTGFTAVHPGHEYDESQAVRALMSGCPHVRSVELEPDAGRLGESLPGFVAAMQQPVFSATSYAHWCLMRSIADLGIKVVINGQGADEALAGYDRYIVGYRLLDLFYTRPQALAAEALAMHRRLGYGWSYLLAQTAKAVLGRRAASLFRGRFSEGGLTLLAPAFRRQQREHLPDVKMQRGPGNLRRHLRSQLMDFGFNQILHYEDQSSMHRSVEIRSPFIDYRLIEFAFALPDEAIFSDGITKRVLREAFASRLPPSIVDSRRKIGFATPFERWVRAPAFRQLIESVVASPEFRARNLWDARRLGARLLDADAVARGFPVWRFLNVELWLRQFGITNV